MRPLTIPPERSQYASDDLATLLTTYREARQEMIVLAAASWYSSTPLALASNNGELVIAKT